MSVLTSYITILAHKLLQHMVNSYYDEHRNITVTVWAIKHTDLFKLNPSKCLLEIISIIFRKNTKIPMIKNCPKNSNLMQKCVVVHFWCIFGIFQLADLSFLFKNRPLILNMESIFGSLFVVTQAIVHADLSFS